MIFWLENHSLIKKTISVFSLVTFLVSFVLSDAYAALERAKTPPGVFDERSDLSGGAVLDVDTFSLPSHLGEVKMKCKGTSPKTIVHIQDAHCNYFAQKKISEIIDYLNSEYGIEMVNLEGGVGTYNLRPFTRIRDKTIRTEVADHFMYTGDISGAEDFALNNPDRVTLWGVEDEALYMDNLKVYRDSLKYRPKAEAYLLELSKALNSLKPSIYSPELLEIDTSYTAYKAGDMSYKDYTAFLMDKTLMKGIDLKKYPNLKGLSGVMRKEKEIDFGRANRQRNKIVAKLKDVLSENNLKKLVAKTIEYKTKRVSGKDFYAFLIAKARYSGIDPQEYEEVSKYFSYLSEYEAIDRGKIMEEMDSLEEELKEGMYRNRLERRLNDLSKKLALAKNILSITLNKTDYEYYKKNKEGFKVKSFTDFISETGPSFGVASKLDGNITDLDRYLEEVSSFYKYSFERDKAFIRNMRYSKLASLSEGAIIMTGGFHTDNLCSLFDEDEISYVSIMPRFKSEEGYETHYFKMLSGETRTDRIEPALRIVLARSTLALASKLSSLGRDVFGSAIIDAYYLDIYIETLKKEMGVKTLGLELIEENGEPVMENGKSIILTTDVDYDGELTGALERVLPITLEQLVSVIRESAGDAELAPAPSARLLPDRGETRPPDSSEVVSDIARSEIVSRLPWHLKWLGVLSLTWLEEAAHLLAAYGLKEGWRQIRLQATGLYSGMVDISRAPPDRSTPQRVFWANISGPLVSFLAGLALIGLGLLITPHSQEMPFELIPLIIGSLTLFRVGTDVTLAFGTSDHELRRAFMALNRWRQEGAALNISAHLDHGRQLSAGELVAIQTFRDQELGYDTKFSGRSISVLRQLIDYWNHNIGNFISRQFEDRERGIVELVSNALDVSTNVEVKIVPGEISVVNGEKGIGLEQVLSSLLIPTYSTKALTDEKIGRFGVGFLSSFNYLEGPDDEMEILSFADGRGLRIRLGVLEEGVGRSRRKIVVLKSLERDLSWSEEEMRELFAGVDNPAEGATAIRIKAERLKSIDSRDSATDAVVERFGYWMGEPVVLSSEEEKRRIGLDKGRFVSVRLEEGEEKKGKRFQVTARVSEEDPSRLAMTEEPGKGEIAITHQGVLLEKYKIKGSNVLSTMVVNLPASVLIPTSRDRVIIDENTIDSLFRTAESISTSTELTIEEKAAMLNALNYVFEWAYEKTPSLRDMDSRSLSAIVQRMIDREESTSIFVPDTLQSYEFFTGTEGVVYINPILLTKVQFSGDHTAAAEDITDSLGTFKLGELDRVFVVPTAGKKSVLRLKNTGFLKKSPDMDYGDKVWQSIFEATAINFWNNMMDQLIEVTDANFEHPGEFSGVDKNEARKQLVLAYLDEKIEELIRVLRTGERYVTFILSEDLLEKMDEEDRAMYGAAYVEKKKKEREERQRALDEEEIKIQEKSDEEIMEIAEEIKAYMRIRDFVVKNKRAGALFFVFENDILRKEAARRIDADLFRSSGILRNASEKGSLQGVKNKDRMFFDMMDFKIFDNIGADDFTEKAKKESQKRPKGMVPVGFISFILDETDPSALDAQAVLIPKELTERDERRLFFLFEAIGRWLENDASGKREEFISDTEQYDEVRKMIREISVYHASLKDDSKVSEDEMRNLMDYLDDRFVSKKSRSFGERAGDASRTEEIIPQEKPIKKGNLINILMSFYGKGRDISIENVKEKLPSEEKVRVKAARGQITQSVNYQDHEQFVFIRELLQNSRDAILEERASLSPRERARAEERESDISIETRVVSDRKTALPKSEVVVRDYVGMDIEKVINFLLIPNRSSKPAEEALTGFFGHGFFTSLREAEEVVVKTSLGDGKVTVLRLLPTFDEGEGVVTDVDYEIYTSSEDFKGTEVVWRKRGDATAIDSSLLNGKAETFSRTLEGDVRVSINGESVEKLDREKAILSEFHGTRGRHSSKVFLDEGRPSTVIQKGLFVMRLDRRFFTDILGIPEGSDLFNLLSKLADMGVVLEIPEGIRLTRDRAHFIKEDFDSNMRALVISSLMDACIRSYLAGKINMPLEFGYDFITDFRNRERIYDPREKGKFKEIFIQYESLMFKLVNILQNKDSNMLNIIKNWVLFGDDTNLQDLLIDLKKTIADKSDEMLSAAKDIISSAAFSTFLGSFEEGRLDGRALDGLREEMQKRMTEIFGIEREEMISMRMRSFIEDIRSGMREGMDKDALISILGLGFQSMMDEFFESWIRSMVSEKIASKLEFSREIKGAGHEFLIFREDYTFDDFQREPREPATPSIQTFLTDNISRKFYDSKKPSFGELFGVVRQEAKKIDEAEERDIPVRPNELQERIRSYSKEKTPLEKGVELKDLEEFKEKIPHLYYFLKMTRIIMDNLKQSSRRITGEDLYPEEIKVLGYYNSSDTAAGARGGADRILWNLMHAWKTMGFAVDYLDNPTENSFDVFLADVVHTLTHEMTHVEERQGITTKIEDTHTKVFFDMQERLLSAALSDRELRSAILGDLESLSKEFRSMSESTRESAKDFLKDGPTDGSIKINNTLKGVGPTESGEGPDAPGAWRDDLGYIEKEAHWLETLASVGFGGLFAGVSGVIASWFGAEPTLLLIGVPLLGAAIAAAVFFFPHIGRGRKVLLSGTVLKLTALYAAVTAIGLLPVAILPGPGTIILSTMLLVFLSIPVARLHRRINLEYIERAQREIQELQEEELLEEGYLWKDWEAKDVEPPLFKGNFEAIEAIEDVSVDLNDRDMFPVGTMLYLDSAAKPGRVYWVLRIEEDDRISMWLNDGRGSYTGSIEEFGDKGILNISPKKLVNFPYFAWYPRGGKIKGFEEARSAGEEALSASLRSLKVFYPEYEIEEAGAIPEYMPDLGIGLAKEGLVHAGFGIAMKGDATVLEKEINSRRNALRSDMRKGEVPEGFSEETVIIEEKTLKVFVHNSILDKLKEEGISLQKFFSSSMMMRKWEYEKKIRSYLGKLKKPLIIDAYDKTPNLFGNCQRDGYIYINSDLLKTTAPLELYMLGVSHELMHEAGIFDDSPASETELAKMDLKIIADNGIDLEGILIEPALAGKTEETAYFEEAKKEVPMRKKVITTDTGEEEVMIDVDKELLIENLSDNWKDLPEGERALLQSIIERFEVYAPMSRVPSEFNKSPSYEIIKNLFGTKNDSGRVRILDILAQMFPEGYDVNIGVTYHLLVSHLGEGRHRTVARIEAERKNEDGSIAKEAFTASSLQSYVPEEVARTVNEKKVLDEVQTLDKYREFRGYFQKPYDLYVDRDANEAIIYKSYAPGRNIKTIILNILWAGIKVDEAGNYYHPNIQQRIKLAKELMMKLGAFYGSFYRSTGGELPSDIKLDNVVADMSEGEVISIKHVDLEMGIVKADKDIRRNILVGITVGNLARACSETGRSDFNRVQEQLLGRYDKEALFYEQKLRMEAEELKEQEDMYPLFFKDLTRPQIFTDLTVTYLTVYHMAEKGIPEEHREDLERDFRRHLSNIFESVQPTLEGPIVAAEEFFSLAAKRYEAKIEEASRAEPVPAAEPTETPEAETKRGRTVSGAVISEGPEEVTQGTAIKSKRETFLALSDSEREFPDNLEMSDVDSAIDEAIAQVNAIYQKLSEKYPDEADIFNAHRFYLEDEGFKGKILERINEGANPARAIIETGKEMRDIFLALDNEYMRQRAPDVADVTLRIVKNLLKQEKAEAEHEGKVVVTEELYPSDIIEVYMNAKAIIVTRDEIGEKSHTAILARKFNIPLIVVGDIQINEILDNAEITVDTKKGKVNFLVAQVKTEPEAPEEELVSTVPEAPGEAEERFAPSFAELEARTQTVTEEVPLDEEEKLKEQQLKAEESAALIGNNKAFFVVGAESILSENEKARVDGELDDIYDDEWKRGNGDANRSFTKMMGYEVSPEMTEEEFMRSFGDSSAKLILEMTENIYKDKDKWAIAFVPERGNYYDLAKGVLSLIKTLKSEEEEDIEFRDKTRRDLESLIGAQGVSILISALEERLKDLDEATLKDLIDRTNIVKRKNYPFNGMINEVHQSDMGRELLNFASLEARLEAVPEGERDIDLENEVKEVAAGIVSHIKTIVIDPSAPELQDDPVAVVRGFLRGSTALPEMEAYDIEELKDMHDALLAIKRSL